MDFHSLTRRELQTLCKKSKIPANMTNVAMVDALKALEIVEGIEEFMQPSQSETAQSSLESLTSSEVPSPYVPPTVSRSTRRRNVSREELETMNSVTRTGRTTRKTVIKVADESLADAIQTPALAAQTYQKKDQMASACSKMDLQLNKCVEEDKKGVLMTPASVGVTSRRRRVDESTVKRVYSTRRSVRLAEKNMEMLNEVKNGESELFNKGLLTKDGENEEMNLKDGLDDFNELSGITDDDEITTMEENSENKDKFGVVSTRKQETPSAEAKLGSIAEGETCINLATEAQMDKENCDNVEHPCSENMETPLDVSNEVHQTDGSSDVYTSEIKVIVEKSEELNTKKDVESQDEAADFVENATLENNPAVNEFSSESGLHDEGEQEFCNDKDVESEHIPDLSVTLVKFTELRLQEATKQVSPGRRMLDDFADDDSDITDHLAIPEQANKDEPDEMETLRLEEREKAADRVPPDARPYGEEAAGNAPASTKNSPSKQLCGVECVEDPSLKTTIDFPEHIPASGVEDDEVSHPSGFAGLDSQLLVEPTCLTPGKHSASEASTMKRMTGLTDNKENIGSGNKLVLAKDRVKSAKNTENVTDLNELSVRKLTKMLKEKLEITNESSKNQHGNKAFRRPALQALPENQSVDETQN